MKLAYIAGPFRAANAWEIEQNVRQAETLALAVASRGYAIHCPHSQNRFFMGALPEAFWLEADLEVLRRCDILVLTQTWRDSTGATAEVEEAHLRGIPVYDGLANLDKKECLWTTPQDELFADLLRHGGNVAATARALRLNETTLRRRVTDSLRARVAAELRERLVGALTANFGNVTASALQLGISVDTINRRLKADHTIVQEANNRNIK